MLKMSISLLLAAVLSTHANAGVRGEGDAGGQMVNRLQGMVRQVTKERDVLKTENAKLKTELNALKKDKDTLEAENSSISNKLAGERSNLGKLRVRQEQTYDKLVEVVEKYKELNKVKNQLTLDLKASQNQYQQTSEQLETCGRHNGKLISAANELLDRYQNKGTFSGLMQSEGLLQFESVEMENIVQEYEDKIRVEEYKETLSLQE